MVETSVTKRPVTPATEAAVEVPTEAATKGPAATAAAEVPAAGAVAEEVQPEPSLAGDAAGGASKSSESETEDKAGAREVEEEEDLFASGMDEGADDTPDDAAG